MPMLVLGALFLVGAAGPSAASSSSTITVHARGRLGTEGLALELNGELVATWTDIATSSEPYSHRISEPMTVDRLRVHSVGQSGWPASLIIDKIEIDGVDYESEAATTRSLGSWTSATGCDEGHKRSEWLQCTDAWFEYPDAVGTALAGPVVSPPSTGSPVGVIAIDARGRLGTEGLELRLNGDTVASWPNVPNSQSTFSYSVPEALTVEAIQVALVGGGWPESLIVDKIEIDGVEYQSEASATKSRGSWTAATGCGVGYKVSEWLQCAGAYFEYEQAVGTEIGAPPEVSKPPATPPGPEGQSSTIAIYARGSQGTENMELLVNGQIVGSWTVGGQTAVYESLIEERTTVDTMHVAFTNDGGWPGADRNLIVDRIEIDGEVYESESVGTRSVGSWAAADGCGEGYKRSEWLHCPDAYFDYEEAEGSVLAPGASPGPGPAPTGAEILVLTKASLYAHPSIDDGREMLDRLASEHGFVLTYSEDSSLFEDPASVERYDAVLFLNTDSVVFETEAEKLAFRRFIEQGRGFIGIHGAAATHWNTDKWDWYRDMVGQRFVDHPSIPNQQATLHVVDRSHSSTAHLPATWVVRDEWYNFEAVPSGVNVLLSIDEASYSGGTMGSDHPVAWNHVFGPGGSRVWYTNLGHELALYHDDHYVDHVLGGIQWVLG